MGDCRERGRQVTRDGCEVCGVGACGVYGLLGDEVPTMACFPCLMRAINLAAHHGAPHWGRADSMRLGAYDSLWASEQRRRGQEDATADERAIEAMHERRGEYGVNDNEVGHG